MPNTNDGQTDCVQKSESCAGVGDGLLGKEDGRVGCWSTINDAIGPSNPLEEENESMHRFELFDNFVVESPELLHLYPFHAELSQEDAEDPRVCRRIARESRSARGNCGIAARTE